MTPCVPLRAPRVRLLTSCAVMALALAACLDGDPAGLGSDSSPLRSHLGSGFYYVDVVLQSSNSGLCNPQGHIVSLYNKNTGKTYSAPVLGSIAHVPVPVGDAGPGFVATYRPISAAIAGQSQAPFDGFAPGSTFEESTCLASIFAPGNSNSTIPLTVPNFLLALQKHTFSVTRDLRTSPAMFVNPANVIRTALDIELVNGVGGPDTDSNGNLTYLLQPFELDASFFPCPSAVSDPELCEFDPAILAGLARVGRFQSGEANFEAIIGLGAGRAYAVEVASNDNSKRWLGACLKGAAAESCKLARTSELARTYHLVDDPNDAQGGPEILFGHGGFVRGGGVATGLFLSSVTVIGEGLVTHKRTPNPGKSARPDDVLLSCNLDDGCTKVSSGKVVRATGFCYQQDGDVFCQSEVVVDLKNVSIVDFGFRTFEFGTTPTNATPANVADATEIRRADRSDRGGTWKTIG